ncbi:MAG: Fe-S cluster assembly protein SufD [Ignavibacteria bacterium]|jgi:Fe-S cluster assembly protein SufD|nr:Fe-S cluster assembly protein SufD [Ignavibacteria bacterium]MCU7503569.1 Fe-S cluster assembly protein SufD [Ignavibacteria bacterium]MCU7516777.1 Fe-S cluster assembly protein SufD [Ignavibacteria bacterium]
MAEIIEKTDLRDYYHSHFQAFENSLNGLKETEIHLERKKAMEQFMQSGFPTADNEEWRYTNPAPILKHTFMPAFEAGEVELKKESFEKYLIKDLPVNLFVFVNGKLREDLSVRQKGEEALELESLSAVMKKDSEVIRKYLSEPVNGFTALNKAFLNDGAVLRIPEGLVLENPVHFLFLSGSPLGEILIQPRIFIIAGKNSQAKIIESHHSIFENAYLFNSVTEIVTEESAVLSYYKIENESEAAFHLSRLQVRQQRSSAFNCFTVTFGGSLVRNDLNSVFSGEYAETNLNGLYLADGKRHIDNHTVIDHAVPHCNSNELYKGILDDKGRGVFNGKVIVRKDAQKTQAYQSNKNLLLSRTAKIDTKPQLEIFADDVKCSHGATVGQLNEEALFYLQSRGVGIEKAQSILINAFASDVIDLINIEKLKETVNQQIMDKLHKVSE